jgi:hypothetical protein
MSAGRYNFTIEQGSTLDLELRYKDSNGDPIDLTGFGGCMQLRPSAGSPTVYISLSSSLQPDGTGLNFSGSLSQHSPSDGCISIYISAASSSALTFTDAVYDLELESGSFVARLVEGRVRLSKEVSIC